MNLPTHAFDSNEISGAIKILLDGGDKASSQQGVFITE